MSNLLAVVPVRGMRGGKTRLSAMFDEEERVALTGAMLRTVLDALSGAVGVDGVGVVTPDPAVALAFPALDGRVELVRQPPDAVGLNHALNVGRTWAVERGATAMLALSADLPLLTPVDIEALVGASAPLVLAPDRHGAGTNAVLLRLDGPYAPAANAFTFGFGERSFPRNLSEADRLGLPVAVVKTNGTAFDLDFPDDWAMLPVDLRRQLLRAPRISAEATLCRA